MVSKKSILNLIFQHFSFPASSYRKEFFENQGDFAVGSDPFLHENIDSYEIYDITLPFKFYLLEYHPDFSTHVFLDANSKLFGHSQTSSHTLSRMHKHNFFEFIYTLDGQLDFVIEGTHRRYYCGESCIINPDVRHVEEHFTPFTALYLSFKPEFLTQLDLVSSHSADMTTELIDFFQRNQHHPGQPDYLDFSPVSASSFADSYKTEYLLYQITEELLHREHGYQNIVMHYIRRLFSYLQTPVRYTCSNTRFQSLTGPAILEKTLAYIHANKRRITRSELELELHYNGNYISRVFLQHTGQTLASYVRNTCLNEAANLLLNTSLNIADIIKQLGFENRTAFYKQFKTKYGVTPQQYRNSNRTRTLN